jgi:hypothetical protein
MNCDWVKANVTLYVYDELGDDARLQLEEHVEGCPQCATELQAMRGFQAALLAANPPEPTSQLLAACRMGLFDSLSTATAQRRWWEWVLWRPLRLAPTAAAILFLAGFGAGIAATYPIAAWRGARVVANSASVRLLPQPMLTGFGAATGWSSPVVEASLAGVRGVTRQPGSPKVNVHFDAIVPQTITGLPDEPRIRQLLMFATRNFADSGVRGDSINLLAPQSQDEHIRHLLMYTMQHDGNPEVRLKALSALGRYVKGDRQVRNAVLQAAVDDRNPGVRKQAVQLLGPVRADASVRQVLEYLAHDEQDVELRNLSRSLLATMPQID